jgi:Holliday junction resolvase
MSQRGHARERAVVAHLREQDWIAFRAPASLGVADVVALRAGSIPRLVEVKSTAQGPYEHFGPADRQKLASAASMAGASAWLVWWPPRASMRWIAESEWPAVRAAA